MSYIADLHLHSRFSRACSKEITIPNLAKWAKVKGIDLLGTGDFLHPLWQQELQRDLFDQGNGILVHDGVKFILSTEVSCIYKENGKQRRIHLVILLPSWKAVLNLTKELLNRKVNLASDGRPIMGISAHDLVEVVLGVERRAVLIPAHCLIPQALVHTKLGVKQIQDIKIGDYVYTHNDRVRKVIKVMKHHHQGEMYYIRPWYFSLGLTTTTEHPFYAFTPSYCPSVGDKCLPTPAHKAVCKHNLYTTYKPSWITASQLKVGDILVFPRFMKTILMNYFDLNTLRNLCTTGENVLTGGNKGCIYPRKITVSGDFCRLIGYYLAEGYADKTGGIGFAFEESEKEYVDDVVSLMDKIFGINHYRLYRRQNTQGVEVLFSSKIVAYIFTSLFYENEMRKATAKRIPDWMLHLPTSMQVELLKGWWRGDGGYTSSRQLMNGMKVICLRLGIIPSITEDTPEKYLKRGKHLINGRTIKTQSSSYCFSNLAFFDDEYHLLDDWPFKRFKRVSSRKHGWIDDNYIYIPIRKIEKTAYQGDVFNLEVEEDNSYLTEFAAVHNCWTPWFSLFGSMSGYDFLEECFRDLSNNIFAVETGLSSDPAMNWQVANLDTKTIVSFSDAHSLSRLGREATIFAGNLSFDELRSDLKNQNLLGTIEFFPEEGMYHYSGHRNCGVVYNGEDLKQKGELCPVCKKPLVLGVTKRVEDLATRSLVDLKLSKIDNVIKSQTLPGRPGYQMLVGLEKIIAESLGYGVASQKVKNEYDKLIQNLGPELKILRETPLDTIDGIALPKVAEGIGLVREGKLSIEPGYDGVYGKVKIWDN